MSPSSDEQRDIHMVVVELHYHSDVIQNLLTILSHARFRVTLLTVPEVLDRVYLPPAVYANVTTRCKHGTQTMREFIAQARPVLASADLVYFNTVRAFWKDLSSATASTLSMVRVHNVHGDLAPIASFYRPMTRLPALASHLIRKSVIGNEYRDRAEFFETVDYLMLPNEPITEYVQSKGFVADQKIAAPVLPFGYLSEPRQHRSGSTRERVTIAITGQVTKNKKDYGLVRKAIERSLQKMDYPLRLVLLGRASDKQALQVVQSFSGLESPMFELVSYQSHVPAPEFEKQMAEVDFLLAPIHIETRYRQYQEIYGKSKMSGLENDLLQARKPCLVTARYRVPEPMEGVVNYFEATPEGLSKALIDWVNNRRYEALADSFDQLSHYRPEKIAARFYDVVQRLVTSG